jgi:glycosyltransferase involved in cell wall biosynthesis
MRPDISIVVLTYNHAPFIRQCLQSVVEQETGYKLEILVGEDGSTDGTAQIVDDLASRYPNVVHVFHRDRADVIYVMGRPTGRANLLKTITAASGRYLAILDGDDFYTDPRKLELQARMLDADPTLSACCHAFLSVDHAGRATQSVWTRPLRPMECAIDIAGIGSGSCPTPTGRF